MKRTKLFTFAFLALVFIGKAQADTEWGPKLELKFTNDAQQVRTLYIGVDANATDGYDSAVVFNFNGHELQEDIDLPPAPPNGLYCTLSKDTNDPYGTQSYVDFKGIPESTTFMKMYRVNLTWYITTYPATVKIDWGSLPAGIDSAKIRCYEWFDEEQYVNMEETENMLLDNEAYRTCYIWLWYNQGVSVNETEDKNALLYPNPTSEILNINDEIQYAKIYSANGELMLTSNTNQISVRHLPEGTYFIEYKDAANTITYKKFIRR